MVYQSGQLQTTIPLQEAIKKLSKYFGLYTVRDLAARIALTRLTGENNNTQNNPNRLNNSQTDANSFDLPAPPSYLTRIIELLIDTSTGGYTTNDIINGINRMTSGEGASSDPNNGSTTDLTNAINQMIQIICKAGDEAGNANPGLESGVLRNSINGPNDSIADLFDSTTVNNNLRQSNRETSPSVSAILMNSVRSLPIHKNINAVTIFMNSIPTLELSKCVPYIDIQFQFGRPPVDGNNQIQSIGLIKFLDGAEISPNGTRRILLDANMVSGSLVNGSNEQFTVAGMEVFTAPQTLVNGDEDINQTAQGSSRRSAQVLDKFRPFLSFKNLTIEVQPTTGFMSFKTAKIDFTLHDKSRIAEIADFIRPDLYSNTEILIEYGWSHPDKPIDDNPYADLLNGMRCKEKYGIINVSMQFDDAGQVNVSLSLAMRGANDFRTETIAGDEEGAGNIIRTIRDISESVSELRRRVFHNNAPGTREVRGIQILDAAGDTSGQLLLTPDLRRELRNFQAALRHSSTPNTNDLRARLDSLYGSNGQGGQINTLRVNLQRNIANKLVRISSDSSNIFSTFPTAINPTRRINGRSGNTVRNVRGGNSANQRSLNEADRILDSSHVSASVPLGKLLMVFVCQPLMATHKFDDIQMIFYPFNQYAGFANTLNIANFEVDTRYFLQQYTAYRMQSVNRAGNLSLQDFINFVATVIVEDPAAPSYGLTGGSGHQFYRTNQGTDGTSTTETTERDSLALQTRIENILRTQTPDGSFRTPQLDYYIECLPRARSATPEGQSNEGSDEVSILRIHVFDRGTTSYDTQAALLEANRDGELRNIGTLPQRSGGNPGVRESQDQAANAIIEAARTAGLIEAIPRTNPIAYRTRGGPQRLKEFMMKTSPYIITGATGTAVKTAALSTIQDPQLSTVNLLRSFHADPLQPNGESPGGLPLQVIPCDLNITSLGCPLLEYGTKFFVDFSTGTTIDNYYHVTGLSHKFEIGSFSTDIHFSPYDGWGRYRSLIDTIRNAQNILNDINNNINDEQNTQNSTNTRN